MKWMICIWITESIDLNIPKGPVLEICSGNYLASGSPQYFIAGNKTF